jgi:hypothetical protein
MAIVSIWIDVDDKNHTFRTEGCSCCSTDLRPTDRDEIIEELKKMYRTIKHACDLLNINLKNIRG